jgi:hypothetical protein
MNVIIRFKSTDERSRFLEAASREMQGIQDRSYQARRAPEVVVKSLTAEELSVLRSLAGDDAEFFDDLKFHPTN